MCMIMTASGAEDLALVLGCGSGKKKWHPENAGESNLRIAEVDALVEQLVYEHEVVSDCLL